MNEKHQLTSEGLANIKSRLDFLIKVERPRNVEALKEARAQGDLSENAEYDAAREEQAKIEGEISELEDIVKNAVVIEEDTHSNNIGKIITILFEDTNESDEFLLVSSSLESNPMEFKISKESPLGKAVVEANIGDRKTVKLESGEEFKVLIKNVKKKYSPSLDKSFKPLIIRLREFIRDVNESGNINHLSICLERQSGYNYVYDIDVFKDGIGHDEDNYNMIERIIKSLLWIVGGYKIYISGSKYIYDKIKAAYTKNGARTFDYEFMENVYEHKFEVVYTDKVPALKEEQIALNSNLDGCRIGFDAGGSDRKVSAVVDGKVIYSEETVWFPKVNPDPEYHYEGILESMKMAASKMPRVDAIGVSSAGIYVNNRIMVASLFLKVSKDDFNKQVKNMYIDVAKEFGNVPLVVANDGDVTALAGAMDLNDNQVLGIAMGTSEATGYVDENGNLKGWLNELAFVPVDASRDAMVDEWSGDYGCGVKYFSQDAVIKLAEAGGYIFNKELSPAEKLKEIQKLCLNGNKLANEIFENIGIYLGYTLAYYSHFYKIKHVLILGRVTSGKGGEIILNMAKEVLYSEFPEYSNVDISMPDEKNRRVGQSIAAASLPKIK